MNLEWLKTGMGPLKDLISWLGKETRNNDVMRKQVIRELRDNLNIFHNAFLNQFSAGVIIDNLSNVMIRKAVEQHFKFSKLKAGAIEPYHISDERNRKYEGWDAEKLMDKIDEKIEELKNLKKMNKDSTDGLKNNLGLMLSNLYFRMKLMADFIRGPK